MCASLSLSIVANGELLAMRTVCVRYWQIPLPANITLKRTLKRTDSPMCEEPNGPCDERNRAKESKSKWNWEIELWWW